MNKLFEFFTKRHIFATLFTVMIILLGLNSTRTLKRDQYPNVDMGEMYITTAYPGASPEDVELNVTNKLEDQLKSVTGIKQITSTSMENVSVIIITIDPDTDLSMVVRPRDLPLLTPVQTDHGESYVWTTFSADQVDLNYANPNVLLEVISV